MTKPERFLPRGAAGPLAQRLQQAIAHHQAGRLQEAEACYKGILRLSPRHADANHNFAVLALQRQQHQLAVLHCRQGLKAKPNEGQYWLTYLTALMRAGRNTEAQQALVTAQRTGLSGQWLAQLGSCLEVEQGGLSAPLVPAVPVQQALAELFNSGRIAEAERRARALTCEFPHHALAWKVLGASLHKLGHLEEALAAKHKATELCPLDAEAHNNLGISLKALGRADAAADSFWQATELNAGFAEAHYNLGSVRQLAGRFDEAKASFQRALALRPGYTDAYLSLGKLWKDLGETAAAVQCYQQLVAVEPGNEIARHLLAVLVHENPERAPDRYVARVFDDYADQFDEHLLGELDYGLPGKMGALVFAHGRPSAAGWDVLDLGCGTGLVGAVVAARARQLVGVDLSARMLAKAQQKNIYTRLAQMELLAMMQQEPAASYDLITCADVFVYMGRLDAVLEQVKRLLRPGGIFSFSCEALVVAPGLSPAVSAAEDYQLTGTGRYAHAASYLQRLAGELGFSPCHMAATAIRLQHGVPVPGWLLLWAV